MRFAIYISVLLALLPLCLLRPFFGLCLYYVVSLMQPKFLCWRPDFQDSLLVGVPMVVGAVVFGVHRWVMAPRISPVTGRPTALEPRRVRSPLVEPSLLLVVLGLLLAYITLTRFLGDEPLEPTSAAFRRLLKMGLVVALLTGMASDERRFRILYAVVALAVAFWAVKGGIRVLMLGPHRVYGFSYDNNLFALTTTMVLPMVFYLGITWRNPRLRIAMLVCCALMGVAVICSESRAGFLAMCVVLCCLAWTSRYRVRALIGVALLAAAALATSSAEIRHRLATIVNYEQDISARSRFRTWSDAVAVMSEHPALGVGFGNYERAVNRVTGGRKAAHNIWLSSLAELGMLGYPLWLALVLGSMAQAWWLTRVGRQAPPELRWTYHLARGLLLALVAYGVHGFFHNEEFLDLAFAVMGLIVALQVLLRRELQARRIGAMLERATPDARRAGRRSATDRPVLAVAPC